VYASINQSGSYHILLTNIHYSDCRVLRKTSCNETVYDEGIQDIHRALHPSTSSVLHTSVDVWSSVTKLFAQNIAILVEDLNVTHKGRTPY